LYGGSVNAENAASIFAVDHVGGALVGGASLDAAAFDSICDSARSQMLKSG
ncbi:MAG: triose-phosphate isomerase, partial [Alphaproteobacteria bacterium]|nr:triose-phosphate isomerase [Alphaproteobacteria bacterium]